MLLDRLIHLALPRIRDFQGISQKFWWFRKLQSRSWRAINVPEINYDKIDQIRGMDVSIITTAKNDKDGLTILKQFVLLLRLNFNL
jgi:large subunit ribosomal protein L5